jgi:hypothetical protein
MRRPDAPASLLVVLLSLAASAAVVVAVLWLGNVTAYTPKGSTPCGRALQELPHLLVRVAGRCHLARQARLWLGLQAAAAALVAGLAVIAVSASRGWLRRRPRR